MAENGKTTKEWTKSPHFWAIVAGIVILANGVIQLIGENVPLGVASLIVGAAAIIFGYLKLDKNS